MVLGTFSAGLVFFGIKDREKEWDRQTERKREKAWRTESERDREIDNVSCAGSYISIN